MTISTYALNVGFEHLGKRAQIALWKNGVIQNKSFGCVEIPLFRTRHRDGSAVHVHFAVSDLVEPCPGQRVFSWGDVFRDRVLKG